MSVNQNLDIGEISRFMKDVLQFPPFIHDETCLSCQGCCRFHSSEDEWRAQVFLDEVYHWREEDVSFFERLFSVDTLDTKACLRTKLDEEHTCQYFDSQTHICQIYSNRPWECRIYPFLVRRKQNELFLSAHLACPYLQDHYGQEKYVQFLKKLDVYFDQDSVQEFLRINFETFPDYQGYDSEISDIRTIFQVTNREEVFPSESRQKIELFRRTDGSGLSVHAFVNLFAWRGFFQFDVREIEGSLCVFAKDEMGCFQYVPPLGGRLTSKMIEECFRYQKEVNQGSNVTRVENVSQEQLKYFPEEKYHHFLKGHEYCYFRRDLEELKGEAYKSKRSDYNQFLKKYDPKYLKYDASMFEDCRKVYQLWMEQREKVQRDDIYLQMLRENEEVHARVIRESRALGLMGRVVQVDQEIVGYTFGFEINSDIFCVLFEICDLNLAGLPVYIFRKFCSDPGVKKYSFINVMDDSGLDNMKRTKLSFRPSVCLPMYNVTEK